MNRRIPIFLACDDNYLPYLAVTVKSISDHGTDGNLYNVKILTSGFSTENINKLNSMELPRVELEIINVEEAVNNHRGSLRKRLRDYYSETIYYRIFIASLFPELERAIYIDCDVVLVDDIAKLYDSDIGDNILGAVRDECISAVPEFCDYIDRWVGVPHEDYINSGVLLINLREFRRAKIEKLITDYVSRYNFDTVAPDQDYLNFLCYGKIHYLDPSWNKQPNRNNLIPVSRLHLIHYNMFNKPWRYTDVPYFAEFWQVADTTPFAEWLRCELQSYDDKKRELDRAGAAMLVENAGRLAGESGGFFETLMLKVK
jgi:lipopolysaccharide biosynthesis glycosyltransferase